MTNGGATAMRNRGRVALVASALMMTTALVPVLLATPVMAQQAGQNSLENQHDFDIPAQSLTRALAQFGVQSGLQVTVDGALVRGLEGRAITGTMRADTALEVLLGGTGLNYDVTGDGTVVIEALQTGAAADGEVLDPVRVEATGVELSGPNDAITDSFVANRSRTASKTDTPVLDDSAAVSVVTQKELETRNVQDLQQALSYTSGVNVAEYGSDVRYDYFRIRGFYPAGGYGNFTDGLARRSYNWTASRSEPYGMQKIDVLKGSTSSLFGMNGPGGLVNMITKRPQEAAGGEVFTTFGESHLTLGGDVTGPVSDDSNWTYRLTGLWQDADRAGRDYSQDDRTYIAPAFTYTPTAETELTILTSYSKRDSNVGHAFPPGVDVDPDTFLGEPDFDTFETEQYDFGYQLSHQVTDQLQFRQNTRFTHLTLDQQQVYVSSSDPTSTRSAWSLEGETDSFLIDNQLEYDTAVNDSLDSKTLAGLEYSYADTQETALLGSASPVDFNNPVYCGVSCITLSPWTDHEIKQRSYAAYGQEQLTVHDDWIVTFGGRYDYVQSDLEDYFGTSEEHDMHAFTSRAGLTYKVTGEVSVYGNYSESFQPVYSNAAGVEGDLKPQEGTQYEVGVKYQPSEFDALFTAALFDLTQTNLVKSNGGLLQEQIGEVNSRGLEIEGKMSLSDRMNMTLAYTYLDAEITEDGTSGNEGNRPDHVPEHAASLWVDYTIPEHGVFGDLTFGAGMRYVDQTYGDSANQYSVSSYTVTDAMLNYKVTDNVSFAVNATNLFDREYVASNNGYSSFYGDGRTILGTLKYSW